MQAVKRPYQGRLKGMSTDTLGTAKVIKLELLWNARGDAELNKRTLRVFSLLKGLSRTPKEWLGTLTRNFYIEGGLNQTLKALKAYSFSNRCISEIAEIASGIELKY